MKGKAYIFFSFLFAFVSSSAFGSHIVGGEVTYVCTGNNNYTATITIYEDCKNGDPGAIDADDPAYICVYNGNNVFVRFDSVHFSSAVSVPTNFSNACVRNAPATCLIKKSFVISYQLPSDPSGYQIVYQRCCRNASITNIANPDAIGASYYCTIPPPSIAPCNNSAIFKNYPPLIVCVNNPLYYDHSAFDPDGDSLSYEFCTAYIGGDKGVVKPVPGPPPYNAVTYIHPFSAAEPMGGYPTIKIDPKTGIISGTPKVLGIYVVTVCCHEWRNGVIINTTKREFQFNVTNCSKAVVADIPIFSDEPNTYIIDCKDYTVHYINKSTGGFNYTWDFGDGTTSTDFEPFHTYPDTGTYKVSLIVNRGTTCPDSINRIVKIYPKFIGDFSDSGVQCPGGLISFVDLSTSTYKSVNYWMWLFGDGDTSYLQNPTHVYSQGAEYNVKLISKNPKGCSDTAMKQLLIDRFRPFAGNDTIVVQGEIVDFDASGGNQFTWTPTSYLSFNDYNRSNPQGHFTDTGLFEYHIHIVSPFGCLGDTSIRVRVVAQSAFFMPTAFTPNGDGINDYFRPRFVGYKSINYFRVYNRWGQMLYSSQSIEQGWDGTYNGQRVETGTYFWEISSINRFGRTEKKKGDVTLIR